MRAAAQKSGPSPPHGRARLRGTARRFRASAEAGRVRASKGRSACKGWLETGECRSWCVCAGKEAAGLAACIVIAQVACRVIFKLSGKCDAGKPAEDSVPPRAVPCVRASACVRACVRACVCAFEGGAGGVETVLRARDLCARSNILHFTTPQDAEKQCCTYQWAAQSRGTA
jgi:hypothetical protein